MEKLNIHEAHIGHDYSEVVAKLFTDKYAYHVKIINYHCIEE